MSFSFVKEFRDVFFCLGESGNVFFFLSLCLREFKDVFFSRRAFRDVFFGVSEFGIAFFFARLVGLTDGCSDPPYDSSD